MAGDIDFDGLLFSFLHTLFKRERKMNFQKSDYWEGITLLLKTVGFRLGNFRIVSDILQMVL